MLSTVLVDAGKQYSKACRGYDVLHGPLQNSLRARLPLPDPAFVASLSLVSHTYCLLLAAADLF